MPGRNPAPDEPSQPNTQLGPRVPEQDPELGFLLRCQELLDRARTVGTGIDHRVRHAIGPGDTRPAVGPSPPGPESTQEAAAALAKLLLKRLLDGQRPPEGAG